MQTMRQTACVWKECAEASSPNYAVQLVLCPQIHRWNTDYQRPGPTKGPYRVSGCICNVCQQDLSYGYCSLARESVLHYSSS
jgi:hypothetical protein